MRKSLLGLLAIAIATVAFFAFKTRDAKEVADVKKEIKADDVAQASLFWYKRTGPDTYVEESDNPKVSSETGCPTTGASLCAKGFTSAQTLPITDAQGATTTLRKTP